MNGLFPEERWKKSETDALLDGFAAGLSPSDIALKVNKGKDAVKARVKEFLHDIDGRATNYRASGMRIARSRAPYTENERTLFAWHLKHGIPPVVTARLLQRSEEDCRPIKVTTGAIKQFKIFSPSLDLILAASYAYFIYKMPVMSDADYDALVKEEIEFGGLGPVLARLRGKSSPQRIKTLALYLVDRQKDEKEGRE